jgi:hypothetical protein
MRDMSVAREAKNKKMNAKKELFQQVLDHISKDRDADFGYDNILEKLNILAREKNFQGKLPTTPAALSKPSSPWKNMIDLAKLFCAEKNANVINYEWDKGNKLKEHELRMRLDMALGELFELQQNYKILDNALKQCNIETTSKKQEKLALSIQDNDEYWKQKTKVFAEELLKLGLAEIAKREGAVDPYFLLDMPNAEFKKLLTYSDLTELGLL